MRHRKKKEKFSRPRAQRKALVKSLVRAVVINGRIITTTPIAKHLKSEVDKIITWAKKGSIFYRRLAYRILGDRKLVKRLFEVIGPQFEGISGGYTRVLRVGHRKGDGASLSLLELTKIAKKEKTDGKKKEKEQIKDSEEKGEKVSSKKDKTPKKGIISGVRKIFKKENEIFKK